MNKCLTVEVNEVKTRTIKVNRKFGAYVLSGGHLKNDSKIKVNYLLKRLKQ